METTSTKVEKTQAETLQSSRPHSKGTTAKESDRESHTNTMAISSVHSAEERPPHGPFNSGPLGTKHIYKLPDIQDANHPRDQVPASPRVLDHLHRSQGWLLAYSHSSKQKAFPRVPLQGPGLAISGHALWAKRSPACFYEGNESHSESSRQGRYLVPALSRRSVADCPDERGMPSNCTKGPEYSEIYGPAGKRNQIETCSSTKIRVVGDRMGSPDIYSTSSGNEVQVSPGGSNLSHHVSVLHKENSDEGARPGQLDRPKRQQHSAPDLDNKTHSETFPYNSPRCINRNSKESENAPLWLDHSEIISPTIRVTNTRSNNPDGRISTRLGFSDKPNLFQRYVRPDNDTLHQCQGVADHLVCTTDGVTEESNNSGALRQLISSARTEKRRLDGISPVYPSRTDMEKSDKIQLDTQGITHSRHIQCPSRSTVQEYSFIHRMDSLTTGFPENPQNEPKTAGGFVCNETEQETTSVCVTLSRSNSSSSKCTNNSMGQVGTPLHVSTDTLTFEGFESTDAILLQKRSTHNTRHAHEAMVYDATTTASTLNINRGETTTGSYKQASSSTQYYKTSRVAVIRTAYQTKFQSCQQTIGLLATPIRPSSLKDYQVKWSKFVSFLTEHNIPPDELGLSNVLDFFSHLFFVKKLRANTVAHYRSALTVPLQLGFQINLHDPAVTQILRAMQIQRPNAPATTPAWSLNKVLQLLDSWPNKVPLDNLLQKTAFLLLLATGWRISELHACVRITEFCSISRDLTLSLRPHPSFLAKNECPQKRWSHKTIPALRLHDGSISKLCPVNTLTEYLSKTARITSGNLLIHPSTQKPMTKHQLSTRIIKLINMAEPDKPIKVHDIRKYAASCSLAETMDISGMVTALQWKSPQTFYKFYMSPTAPVKVPARFPNVPDVESRRHMNSQESSASNEEDTSDN